MGLAIFGMMLVAMVCAGAGFFSDLLAEDGRLNRWMGRFPRMKGPLRALAACRLFGRNPGFLWRSALLSVAINLAIVGTFAALAMFGFSLNNLTLFGLVLAIGIVVDDAIVVVEAVEQNIERGLAPREATMRAMEEVTGPVIAVGLVLAAVFIPCAFVSGLVGQFFQIGRAHV